MFQCDLHHRTGIFRGEYSFSLNSSDLYKKDDALQSSRSFGGTMVMWKKEFDAHVTVHSVSTPAFLPIVFTLPGLAVSVHICIYLPTQGKETRFLEDLASLSSCISEMKALYPDALFYLRGDFNTSRTNLKRTPVLEYFTNNHCFKSVSIQHTTYHHFLGDGLSDSHLDQLLYPLARNTTEELSEIVCKLSNPLVNSHHDVLISTVKIPHVSKTPEDLSKNTTAPRLQNSRSKIIWTEAGAAMYRDMVSGSLQHIQDFWLSSSTTATLHVALQATNSIMSRAACMTNKSILLNKPFVPRSAAVPKEIKISQKALLKMHRHLRSFNGSHSEKDQLRSIYNKNKKEHRKLERKHAAMDSFNRDSKLFSILSSNPAPLYKSIKSSKSSQTKVHTLHVGSETYVDKNVPDGFYDSISSLKSWDKEHSTGSDEFFLDYEYIMNICSSHTLPPISY